MGVFLRWGIFGILSIAALVYAYNALGSLAEHRRASPAVVAAGARDTSDMPAARGTNEAPAAGGAARAEPADVENDAIPGHCQVELDIARRAATARSIGEPLDRVLRIQEIAWQQDETLRARYTELARHWYAAPGPVDDARLRREVVTPCLDATP